MYEYQKRIQRIIWDNEDYWCIDNEKESEELKEVYKKAEAFDEVKKFATERLKEQELTDEYDYGERFMCEEIERLLEDKQNE